MRNNVLSFTIAMAISTILLHQDCKAETALAQGAPNLDDEIFGTQSTPPANGAPSRPPPSTHTSMTDSLQIGGRLEVRSGTGVQEHQKFTEGSYSQLRQADVYFDTRPNKDLRAFLRARLSEEKPTTTKGGAAVDCGDSCVKTQIDEAWLKWDLYDHVFFTYGKQHLKWGSSRVWNPTDFTAVETRDPFALYDRRLGQELLKIHIPIEKQAYNLYAIAQTDSTNRNDRAAFGLRGEFAIAGRAELALSAYTRPDQPLRLGSDLSTALGPVDLYVESAFSRRESRLFYEGELEPDLFQLPSATQKEDQWFHQTVGGVQYAFKYSDDDALTVGLEYLYNQLGYEDRTLELYSLFNRQTKALYAGRRYVSAFARLPNPGPWNETSFFLTGIRNLSDETSVVRLTTTWLLLKDATVDAFVSQCQGDYGELCFRVPAKIAKLASTPGIPEEQRAAVRALPEKRTIVSAGMSAQISF